MLIYVMLVLAIVCLYFPLRKRKKLYCSLVGIMLFLVLAFRDFSIGTDVKMYVSFFNIIKDLSFNQVIYFCRTRDIEFIYYFFNKIISLFSQNPHVYIAVCSIPYIFCVSRFIYKYSKQPLLSFLIFLALNYYAFSFSALRHCVAASFLILSFDYLYNKKYFPFLISVLIASLFHRTALVFLILYPLVYFKIGYKQIIGIVSAILGAFIFKDRIINLLHIVFNSGHFSFYTENNTSLSLWFFIFNCLIYFFELYILNINKNKEENTILLNLQFFCICFAALTPILAEMIRISMFFGIFSTVGLTNTIAASNNKYNILAYYLIISLLLIIYFLYFSLPNHKLIPYISIFGK